MMLSHARSLAAFALLAVFALPACDKGDAKQAKAEEKTEDKAEAKAEEKTPAKAEEKAEEKPASEVAEVEAGGRVEIKVDGKGYHPAEIHAPPKSKITLVFNRPDEKNCGEKLVMKAMELEKDLPAGETVEIEVEVPETGELGFACGMDMYKGKVVPKA